MYFGHRKPNITVDAISHWIPQVAKLQTSPLSFLNYRNCRQKFSQWNSELTSNTFNSKIKSNAFIKHVYYWLWQRPQNFQFIHWPVTLLSTPWTPVCLQGCLHSLWHTFNIPPLTLHMIQLEAAIVERCTWLAIILRWDVEFKLCSFGKGA